MSTTVANCGMLAVRFALRRNVFTLNIDVCISTQGVTGIFGPSGAGKTTLLRCIAGLEQAVTGRMTVGDKVWVDSAKGTSLAANQRDVGYVFQGARLFPHLNVQRNLEYGRKRAHGNKGMSVEHAIELLGLAPLLDRRPQTLSGGEAQRVAIGRAILRSPSLLLMDEPLASLDAAHKNELLPLFERLHAELGIPVLYVSHSIDEICLLCDQLLVLDNGQVVANGHLQGVLMRTDLPVLAGEEAGTVIRGSAPRHDARFGLSRVLVSGGELYVPGRYPSNSSALRLRIRANDVSLCREHPAQSSILNLLDARIEEVREESDYSALVHMRSGTDHLLARVTRKSVTELALRPGDEVIAQIKSVSVRTPTTSSPACLS